MMTITSTTNSVSINDGQKTVTAAKNSLFYLQDESNVLNFYTRGSAVPVISVKLGETTVDGTLLTEDNVDTLLEGIAFSGGGGGGYVLPTATSSRLGGVKIGSGVSVAADGTISVQGGSGSIEVVEYDDIDTAKGLEIYAHPEKYAIKVSTYIHTLEVTGPGYVRYTVVELTDSYKTVHKAYVTIRENGTKLVGAWDYEGLDDYTPTADFATINGQSITEGGDIEIESGEGNYLVVDSLDDITEPYEGLRAYVKSHTDYEEIEGITFDISNAYGQGQGRVLFGYVESVTLEFPENTNDVRIFDRKTMSWVTMEEGVLYTDNVGFWLKLNSDNTVSGVYTKEYDHRNYEFLWALEGATYEESSLEIPVFYPAKNYVYYNGWKSTDILFINKMTDEERAALWQDVYTAYTNMDNETLSDIFSRIRVNEGGYEGRKFCNPTSIFFEDQSREIQISYIWKWENGWGTNMFMKIRSNGYMDQNYGETVASSSNLGVVKIGSGINISDDGTISVEGGGGGGDYLAVDSLDDIDEPVEGMAAFVKEKTVTEEKNGTVIDLSVYSSIEEDKNCNINFYGEEGEQLFMNGYGLGTDMNIRDNGTGAYLPDKEWFIKDRYNMYYDKENLLLSLVFIDSEISYVELDGWDDATQTPETFDIDVFYPSQTYIHDGSAWRNDYVILNDMSVEERVALFNYLNTDNKMSNFKHIRVVYKHHDGYHILTIGNNAVDGEGVITFNFVSTWGGMNVIYLRLGADGELNVGEGDFPIMGDPDIALAQFDYTTGEFVQFREYDMDWDRFKALIDDAYSKLRWMGEHALYIRDDGAYGGCIVAPFYYINKNEYEETYFAACFKKGGVDWRGEWKLDSSNNCYVEYWGPVQNVVDLGKMSSSELYRFAAPLIANLEDREKYEGACTYNGQPITTIYKFIDSLMFSYFEEVEGTEANKITLKYSQKQIICVDIEETADISDYTTYTIFSGAPDA